MIINNKLKNTLISKCFFWFVCKHLEEVMFNWKILLRFKTNYEISNSFLKGESIFNIFFFKI